jgi:hypothetical protein
MEYRLLAVRPERGKRHRPSHGEYRQHEPRRSLRSEIRRYSITLGFGRYRYRFRGRHIQAPNGARADCRSEDASRRDGANAGIFAFLPTFFRHLTPTHQHPWIVP